jgi:SHS2 domain-containing protein
VRVQEQKEHESADAGVSPSWLRPFEHTADLGFTVVAGNEAELFSRAAWGMFDLLTDMRDVNAGERISVAVAAGDRAALMVRWLSELNFLHTTTHRVFCRFDVHKATDTEVEAEVAGERIDPARHAVYTEIKAVTFHGLRVEQVNGVWSARILFDV